MIGLKNSYEIAYNGTENECRFELYADTAADLQGLTHFDGIKIQMGSECTDIATGAKYILNGSGVWVLQPSANAFANVYTKVEIDSMITEINGVIAYYHTVIVSDTGEITFYALAGYIGTWKIYGNGQQTGTPTPDAPIMPTFCGVRTGNLFPQDSLTGKSLVVKDTFNEIASSMVFNNGQYAISMNITTATLTGIFKLCFTYTDDSQDKSPWITGRKPTMMLISNGAKVVKSISITDYNAYTDIVLSNIMLNSGTTALPYEPYGYKIPITCAGQTNNVYMSAPLRKAIDGSDAVDTIDSSGTLTRNVDENGDALVTPTTETVSVPNIPTFSGENTLTVDTELKPSRIEIQGGYHA